MHPVNVAMGDGFALDQTAVKDSWQHDLSNFQHGHLRQQQLFHNVDIASEGISISMHFSTLQMFSTAA